MVGVGVGDEQSIKMGKQVSKHRSCSFRNG